MKPVTKIQHTLKMCHSLSPNDFTYFSHSFQSSFHLSLTVLVRYRSPRNIQIQMDITTLLCCSPKQHDSQDAHCNRSQPARNTSITFFGRLSQQPFTRQRYLQIRTSRPQFPRHKAGDFRIELFPLHSPLLGESLLVSFPPLINMLKFSGYSHLI